MVTGITKRTRTRCPDETQESLVVRESKGSQNVHDKGDEPYDRRGGYVGVDTDYMKIYRTSSLSRQNLESPERPIILSGTRYSTFLSKDQDLVEGRSTHENPMKWKRLLIE